MLINVSNHASSKWKENQIITAIAQFDSITDMDFPAISPNAETEEIMALSRIYLLKIIELIKESSTGNNAVHIMGEFTFTFNLLEMLKMNNITALASTTTRNVYLDGNGNKISEFSFVRFRRYY